MPLQLTHDISRRAELEIVSDIVIAIVGDRDVEPLIGDKCVVAGGRDGDAVIDVSVADVLERDLAVDDAPEERAIVDVITVLIHREDLLTARRR
mgnify:CR=1 FL=1